MRLKFRNAVLSSLLLAATASQNVFAMAGRPNPDPNAPPPPAWVQWMPIAVMVFVFYFLIIRPQSRQRKERENLLSAIKPGDKIVTQGGLIATVIGVRPDSDVLDIKLNEETKVKIRRSGVSEVLKSDVEAAGVAK